MTDKESEHASHCCHAGHNVPGDAAPSAGARWICPMCPSVDESAPGSCPHCGMALEPSVGLLNGLALGTLLGAVAYLWQGNAVLGLVVGGALAINTLVAVSIGGTVPLVLKGLRADPALASGPVLTTITDMFGFFLVLGLATLALPWLT